MRSRIFNITKWTSLEKTIEQKYNVLLSLFATLGIGTALMQIIIDASFEFYTGALMDAAIFAVMIAVYVLNESRKHLIAKLLFSGVANTLLFIYANIIPIENGAYLYFFSIIGITALIFSNEGKFIRNFMIALPIAFIVVLEIYEYQTFGYVNIQEGIEGMPSFPINMLISIVVMVLSIYQMMMINKEIDNNRIVIADELRVKNKELKKINTELDHFVYSTSHDLKAPLASISGLVNVAQLEIKEAKALEYFQLINGRIDKLNSFIGDIIDLSRNARLEIQKEKVNLTAMINSVIDNYRYMTNAESVNYNIEINKNLKIDIDRPRLEVVLNNLISNAIKYHKKLGKKYIDISACLHNGNLDICVEDNGIGIAEKHKEKVFDMFYRGHEDSEGSGLGLYIVADVIAKLNGNIELESVVDTGTKVSISIPV